MSRQKKKVIENVTLEAAQEASSAFATAANKLSKIEASMNEKINRIKDQYKDEISELEGHKAAQMDVLEAFARESKDTWGKRKSYELLHTTIGYRTGNPAVGKDKKFTWEAVLSLMKTSKVFARFIRTKDEINKEAILAEKDIKVLSDLKGKCFVHIVQEEAFYVEAKVEEVAA